MADVPVQTSLLIFVLLLIAVAIGFALGRRSRPVDAEEPRGAYMRGLDYLVNEQADTAVDAFVGALDVNDDTADTHLALGALLRRRGEADKAIRLHQNLLARPRLSARFRSQAELELARDYLAAGLLGRAESLLEELAERGGEIRDAALEYLLEVYQREREWQGAVDVARELATRGEGDIRRTLAHYLCELAEQEIAGDDVRAARHFLAQALEWDDACVRASLLLARLHNGAGRWRDAVRALERVVDQDARFVGVALPELVRAHEELGAERDLLRTLERWSARAPSTAVVEHLAGLVAARSGNDAARAFLARSVADRPTVRGLERLLASEAFIDGTPSVAIERTRAAVGALGDTCDPYLCDGCGLSGRVLHWQCPGCRAWGTTAPAKGLLGD